MGNHDDYGKRLIAIVAGSDYEAYGPAVEVDYGAGQPARIDGAVGKTIAVEIESRTSKQVRGSVLDLICHPYGKKLLVLLPVHMSNPVIAKEQCQNALSRFLDPADYEVILLNGHGDAPSSESDTKIIRVGLSKLGYESAT